MIIDRTFVSPVFDTTSTSPQFVARAGGPTCGRCWTETTSAGGFSHTGLSPLVAAFMKSAHTGTARSPA